METDHDPIARKTPQSDRRGELGMLVYFLLPMQCKLQSLYGQHESAASFLDGNLCQKKSVRLGGLSTTIADGSKPAAQLVGVLTPTLAACFFNRVSGLLNRCSDWLTDWELSGNIAISAAPSFGQ